MSAYSHGRSPRYSGSFGDREISLGGRFVRRITQAVLLIMLIAGVAGLGAFHKSVTLEVDGEITQLDTYAAKVDSVLDTAGVQVNDDDMVAPALDSVIMDGGSIVVRTASPLDVVIDGKVETVMTSAETVDELLAALGARGNNALVQTSRSARVDRDGAPLRVSTEKTVRISVDGNVIEARTSAMTVGEMLAEREIFLHEDDTSSVPLGAPTVDGMAVLIGRHSTSDGTERTTLPYKTVEVEDDSLPKGDEKVVTPGRVGERVVTYTATMVDGEEVDREILTEIVVADAVDEVIHIGTKEVPDAPDVEPGSNRELGRKMAAERGWGDDEFKCLNNLWTRESNWDHTAQNPSSSAYGIPQSLPGSKMASVADDWETNPETQITWGLNYIKDRYGTPCGAWAKSETSGWY